MNARFLHSSARNANSADQRRSGDAVTAAAGPVGVADRACCCPARAAVRVIMPATAGRPGETDLLLCGHHYRVSRDALARAHAVVFELPGTAADTAAWIGLR
jgi:hypothetical protein